MANPEEKVEKIEELSGSHSSNKVEREIEAAERASPNKEHFDSLMDPSAFENKKAVGTRGEEGKVSLMDQIKDINQKVDAVKNATPETIVFKTQEVIKQIQEVKTQLASPNLELKGSVQNVLKNKLSHIDESLKVALNRAGIEYTPPPSLPKSSLIAPIERFIGFLTHGQYQLQKLSNDIEMMHLNQKEITPASMIAIQMKVGFVQQEIEFFANVLNKALESTKTIMNVQI